MNGLHFCDKIAMWILNKIYNRNRIVIYVFKVQYFMCRYIGFIPKMTNY